MMFGLVDAACNENPAAQIRSRMPNDFFAEVIMKFRIKVDGAPI